MLYKIRRTKVFAYWLDDLRDDLVASAIAKRIARIELGNFGDAQTIGDGVRELRIHYGPGYRIYFQVRRNEIVLLLCGGDKSSQKRDIEQAKKLAGSWDD
jgi:putative addiction module killer protein